MWDDAGYGEGDWLRGMRDGLEGERDVWGVLGGVGVARL